MMDLLMRSKGRMHQRWQIAVGKPRAKSMSISYAFNGRNAIRVLSARSFRDFSTGKIPFSPRIWINGSGTPFGGLERSGVDQQRSKSAAVISLLSTKTFCMLFRPSSISPAGTELTTLLLFLGETAGGFGGSGAGESVGKLLA